MTAGVSAEAAIASAKDEEQERSLRLLPLNVGESADAGPHRLQERQRRCSPKKTEGENRAGR